MDRTSLVPVYIIMAWSGSFPVTFLYPIILLVLPCFLSLRLACIFLNFIKLKFYSVWFFSCFSCILHNYFKIWPCVSIVHTILLLNNIPLYGYTTVRLSIYLLMTFGLFSSLGLLRIDLLWTHKSLCGHIFSFHLGVEWLSYEVRV